MIKTRVIPSLLFQGRGLVKTVKFKDPVYIGDPINAVRIFNEKECHELVVLDITATIQKRPPDFKFVQEIAEECFMPFAYGGGIRSLEDIKTLVHLGVEKVIINSYAFENPDFISEAARTFGSSTIVVSIDVKKNFFGKYEVFVWGGRKNTSKNPKDYALEMERRGAGEIFLNSIDRDGVMKGYDLSLIRSVSSAVNIPVIACGGAGKIEDLGMAVNGGASAVSAGSLFVFWGRQKGILINFPSDEELLRVFSQ